jgi:hypothetical protein
MQTNRRARRARTLIYSSSAEGRWNIIPTAANLGYAFSGVSGVRSVQEGVVATIGTGIPPRSEPVRGTPIGLAVDELHPLD